MPFLAYCNDYAPVDFVITLCYFSHVNNIQLIDWLIAVAQPIVSKHWREISADLRKQENGCHQHIPLHYHCDIIITHAQRLEQKFSNIVRPQYLRTSTQFSD